ncbi:DEAD/DEAH box helicase, partial [Ruminococcaceae bacterium OttesenSCG-928-O06]|nr:DEAD/DEAH box helicase [Ruminococcaceae bacterium OttesenSCG-928-O06]
MTFQDLQLDAPLLRAVKEAGYARPTPIQQKAIPPVLAGRDLLGCAQTGTGKTAAFALPILQRLAAAPIPQGKGRLPRALVLTPTRELALQIEESFVLYAKHLKLRSAVIYGGVGQAPQVQQLKAGVDILTATPGRLNDLIGQGYIKLSAIEVFVLDEADRMLDMGFVNDVKKVIAHLPAQRQTLLFSATMPGEIVQLANSLLKDPVKVFVTPPATTVQAIAQQLYGVEKADKRKLLAQLLQAGDVQSALVFTRTKHGADRVVRDLKRDGVAAAAIHGNKSQTARQTALARLKKGEIQALVATDIAARGLDINELSHVFNYDLPNIPETYVHRIGRTGRAGHGGIAVSFCTLDEYPYLLDIEKLIGFALPRAEGHPWHLPLPTGAAPQKAPAPKTAGSAARTKQKTTAPAAKNQQKPAAKAQEKPAA